MWWNSKKLELNDTELNKFSIQLADSSDELIFQMEALPIDVLIVNGIKLNGTEECKSGDQLVDTVKCLESNLSQNYHQIFKRCTNTVRLNLTYDFDNQEIYKELNLIPKSYDVEFDFECK